MKYTNLKILEVLQTSSRINMKKIMPKNIIDKTTAKDRKKS